MSAKYRVIATTLNVRSAPLGAIVGRLKKGDIVQVTRETEAGAHVWAEIGGGRWVAKSFLSPLSDTPALPACMLNGVASSIFDTRLFLFPLVAAPHAHASKGHYTSLFRACAYLNIEAPHHALRPRRGATYCNVYAFQFVALYASLSGVNAYLPRVWWLPDALARLQAGEEVAPILDYANMGFTTVSEISANGLYDWLDTFGGHFGWEKRDYTPANAVYHANQETLVLLAAKHADPRRSGHITIVLPEMGALKQRGAFVPQSQAGTTNIEAGLLDWQHRLRHQYSDMKLFYLNKKKGS